MESSADITDCKIILDDLERTNQIKDDAIFKRLAWIYEHLPLRVAPRLQKEYDTCMTRSHNILAALFDKIELSNKHLLNSFLRLQLAYGHFRIAKITYHIETPRDAFDFGSFNTPEIVKRKWYDLSPLLPSPCEDSELSWKHLMIHTLVVDEPHMFQISFRLLIQKLHFLAVLLSLERYSLVRDKIMSSGKSVAEKIGEKIYDFAHDDFEVIGIDSFLFNLLLPFTSIEQQTAIIEAGVLARFKSQILENSECKKSIGFIRLNELLASNLMNSPILQEILFTKLIEHLKCSILRRKRRHSVESIEENSGVTLEDCLQQILDGHDSREIISGCLEVIIESKKLQKTYLSEWITFISSIASKNNLTAKSSSIIFQTCSLLLITTSNLLDDDRKDSLATLMAKVIDVTGQRWSQVFFKTCGPDYIIELTRHFAERTDHLDEFSPATMCLYSSYLSRYIRISIIMKHQQNADNFTKFVNFVCDNEMGKDKSHLLEYIIVRALSQFVDDISTKGCNKSLGQFLEHNKILSKKLYKFIKRNITNKSGYNSEHEESPIKQNSTNGNNGILGNKKQALAVEALSCILKIAIERKAQETLDMYGDLMLKLYNIMCARTSELTAIIRQGTHYQPEPLDDHLAKLMSLYVDNRFTIEPYLCYNLIEKISSSLISEKDLGDAEQLNAKLVKKDNYSDIKAKLDAVQKRGQDSELVYQTLINRQYNSVADQTVAVTNGIEKAESCCEGSVKHVKTTLEILQILFHGCDDKTYACMLDKVSLELRDTDALNHPTNLYLFILLEALLPKQGKSEERLKLFQEKVSSISSNLIRISKLVELGPSIHAFANAGEHKSAGAIQCCTYSNCIKVFTLIMRRFPAKVGDQFITDAMQICVCSNLARYSKYSIRLNFLFIRLASSIVGLLKSICIGRKHDDSLKSSMPIFLSILTNVIKCVILASDRQKLTLSQTQTHQMSNGYDIMDVDSPNSDTRPKKQLKEYESMLEYIAHDIGRLMNNLSFLEVKLIDYAPHIISSYVKDIQRTSCSDIVKKHLDEGVFRIFNLVDAFQKEKQEAILLDGVQRRTSAARNSGSLFDMIFARLDQASREIFRNMHDTYNKFHRYQGKC